MSSHTPTDRSPTPAEDLFAQYLVHPSTGSNEYFEELCRAHTELAPELHELFRQHERRREMLHRIGLGTILPEASAPSPPTSSFVADVRARQSAPDRYVLRSLVGKGGMGTVYEAEDTLLGRIVALKVISDVGTSERYLLLFRREILLAAGIDHPGVASVHDAGVDAHGRLFFTMPLVRGRDLSEVFASIHRGDEEWTLPRAVGVLRQVCETMSYLHSRGIIHRDLKPSNIRVGPFGEVFVMDWGVAKELNDSEVHAAPAGEERSGHATLSGGRAGTPRYMSPEQARGDAAEIRPATDVYAIGAMLYELISGQAPYAHVDEVVEPRTVLTAVLEGPPEPLQRLAPRAPAPLLAICERAMARRIPDRYSGMRELAVDLQAFLDLRVVDAYPSGPWARAALWMRRNPALSVASGGFLVLVLGLVVGAVRFREEQSRRAVLERASTVARLIDELQNVHLQLLLPEAYAVGGTARVATRPGLDPDAFTARVSASFSTFGLNLDRRDGRAALAQRLPEAFGEENVPALLTELYAFARSIEPQLERRTTQPEPTSPMGRFREQVLAAIDHLERSSWRKTTWQRWLGNVRTHVRESMVPSAESLADVSPDDLVWLAELDWALGERSATRSLYEKALDGDPGSFMAHFRLGMFTNVIDGQDMQLAHLRTAVALRPHVAAAWFNLGGICKSRLENGSTSAALRKEAIHCFSKAIELSPSSWVGYNNLALVTEDTEERLSILRRCLEKNGPVSQLLENVEFICLGAHDTAGAREAAWLGISTFPDLAIHYYHLGRAFDDDGDNLACAVAYRQAAAVDGSLWPAWTNACAAFLRETLVEMNPDASHLFAAMALESAEHAFDINPNQRISVTNLAYARGAAGNVTGAIEGLVPLLATEDCEDVCEYLQTCRDGLLSQQTGEEVIARIDYLLMGTR